jgi:hypothetical protein
MVLIALLAMQGLGWMLISALSSIGDHWSVFLGLSPGAAIAAVVALLLPRQAVERMSLELDQGTSTSGQYRRRPANFFLGLIAGVTTVLSIYTFSLAGSGSLERTPVVPIEIGLIISFFGGLASGLRRSESLGFGFQLILGAAIMAIFGYVLGSDPSLPLRPLISPGPAYFAGIGANIALCFLFWMFGLLMRRSATHGIQGTPEKGNIADLFGRIALRYAPATSQNQAVSRDTTFVRTASIESRVGGTF